MRMRETHILKLAFSFSTVATISLVAGERVQKGQIDATGTEKHSGVARVAADCTMTIKEANVRRKDTGSSI